MTPRFIAFAVSALLLAGCASAGAELAPADTTTTSVPVTVAVQTTNVPAPDPDPTSPVTAPPVTVPPPVIVPPVTVPLVAVPAAEGIVELICQAFGDECAKAVAVATCESGLNPATVGGAGERGLFQIHPVHAKNLAAAGLSWEQMFDPAANIHYAHLLWSRAGWGPWTCA